MKPDLPAGTDSIIRHALMEDIGTGDITSSLLIDSSVKASASILAKEKCVIAGLLIAQRVFELAGPSVRFVPKVKEGALVKKGVVLATVSGSARSILAGERTALNLLQRMSGIATCTRDFVKMIAGTGATIADTRKTAPGLRAFDKYAVRAGGGRSHRAGLFDGILIKDNHIAAAGGITKAVRKIREGAPHLMKIEVEAGSISEVREAVRAGVDCIMLDNMSIPLMKRAVAVIRSAAGSILIEASGNIGAGNAKAVAETGVDIISAGVLTHSVRAADLSMKFD